MWKVGSATVDAGYAEAEAGSAAMEAGSTTTEAKSVGTAAGGRRRLDLARSTAVADKSTVTTAGFVALTGSAATAAGNRRQSELLLARVGFAKFEGIFVWLQIITPIWENFKIYSSFSN
ncbi:unnamed protein product [Cuscuta europaea]|uniref:Uncharacterized protein n=1 Tax=Cuscuta europaea TaxID=41803 RepID=A0A9P1DXM1_CUSEU|nr:unnamed protein product [Cuscuta europaea]